MTTKEIVENIKSQAKEDANNSIYCLNCKFSYFRHDEEQGYCKYQVQGAVVAFPPLIVNEYHSCEFWKNKNALKDPNF